MYFPLSLQIKSSTNSLCVIVAPLKSLIFEQSQAWDKLGIPSVAASDEDAFESEIFVTIVPLKLYMISPKKY